MLGIPARKVGANFSSAPQMGKLKALMWTATPRRGTSTCVPAKAPRCDRRSRWRAPGRRARRRSGRRCSSGAGRVCRELRSSLLRLPGAVLDPDHHARTLVEAEVIGRAHVEDAVRAGHVLLAL